MTTQYTPALKMDPKITAMSSNFIPAKPLEKIALSCSGGGYRAAAFHLGTMAYLYHLKYDGRPLLDNVKMISTVSGGTITGAVYALMKAKGEHFPAVYQFLIKTLDKVDLVREGLENMRPQSAIWKDATDKRKNLINAFSLLYDKYFTENATFGDLNRMRSHLEAVVFNTTEFNNAINFRFRNKGTGFFGNYRIRVPDESALEVKLADAIAASTCFPGGFEPMCWPQDFLHANSPNLKALNTTTQPIGIMDGGIYDNQGIDSILAYRKNNKGPYFDLIIVSDVASPYMDPFKFEEDSPKKGWLQLNYNMMIRKIRRKVFWLQVGLFTLFLGPLVLPFLWQYAASIFTGLCLGLSASGLILLITYYFLSRKVKAFIKTAKRKVDGFHDSAFYLEKLSHLRIEEISFRRLQTLLLDRLNSMLSLLSSVFLKVIRRHHYQKLYTDEQYQYRRITSLIKELTEADYSAKNKRVAAEGDAVEKQPYTGILKGSYDEVVGSKIADLVNETSEFGTTLWFTEEQKLRDLLQKLVSTGEVTMCYNMVEYLERLQFTPRNGYAQLPAKTRKDIADLYDQCKNDWLLLKENPLALMHPVVGWT